MSEFFTARDIKATRQEHICSGCHKSIQAKGPAWYFATKTDGCFFSGHYHADCRVAEFALNELYPNRWDEWVSLRDCKNVPEDAAWLKAEYPAVAARMFRSED